MPLGNTNIGGAAGGSTGAGGGIGGAAMTGAGIGSLFGPIGTAVGAGLGIALKGGAQLYRGLQGRKQTKEANAMNPIRPEYDISESDMRSLSLDRSLSNQVRLPGQSAMEDNLSLATSQGIAASQKAGGSAQSVLANASNIVGNQSRSLNSMTIAGAQLQRQSQAMYSRSLQRMGGLEDMKWGINKMVPFQNEVEKKEALKASGMANTYGALGGAGDLAFESANYFGQKKGF